MWEGLKCVKETGYRCGRERHTNRSERKRERQGREIEKDKKRFRVGERKIGRETGVVQRERERERKRDRDWRERKRERENER